MPNSSAIRIRELLRGIDIPPCPAVLAALTRELQRDDRNAGRISRLIAQDVSLAAGIMKIANSSYFQPARQVGSLDAALAFIGFGEVFNLLVGEVLERSLAEKTPLGLDRYWDSAAYTAAACAHLSIALPGTNRENAYCFGLFHDCGIPVLMRRFADYRETLQLANDDKGGHFSRIEEARHGTHHAVIGHLLSRNWGLSSAISQAILCHHDYSVFDKADGLPRESLTLIAINLIAEHIVGRVLRESCGGEWNRARHHVANFFGLTEGQINDLGNEMMFRIESRQAA